MRFPRTIAVSMLVAAAAAHAGSGGTCAAAARQRRRQLLAVETVQLPERSCAPRTASSGQPTREAGRARRVPRAARRSIVGSSTGRSARCRPGAAEERLGPPRLGRARRRRCTSATCCSSTRSGGTEGTPDHVAIYAGAGTGSYTRPPQAPHRGVTVSSLDRLLPIAVHRCPAALAWNTPSMEIDVTSADAGRPPPGPSSTPGCPGNALASWWPASGRGAGSWC